MAFNSHSINRDQFTLSKVPEVSEGVSDGGQNNLLPVSRLRKKQMKMESMVNVPKAHLASVTSPEHLCRRRRPMNPLLGLAHCREHRIFRSLLPTGSAV